MPRIRSLSAGKGKPPAHSSDPAVPAGGAEGPSAGPRPRPARRTEQGAGSRGGRRAEGAGRARPPADKPRSGRISEQQARRRCARNWTQLPPPSRAEPRSLGRF
ncbi:uncharacterized protein LOC143694403 [Agelaius phoeniceus]|uniref:uncharacterized protein LOC143694403 n=1 Tax=Agelaius phoeniceus TaxID=39638 RepID=UPI004054B73F